MKRSFVLNASLCIAVIFIVLLQTSCEKVIHIDLESASALVIEGNVVNKSNTQIVSITKSVSVDDESFFPGVSGAVVKISDNEGRNITLLEVSKGIYATFSFLGRPNRTYTLSVLLDGKEYKATSTMPPIVTMDSLKISVTSFFNESYKAIEAYYTDPPTVANYYKFSLLVNNVPSKNIFSYNDEFTDGKVVSRELRDFDVDLESGDDVKIEMQNIDKNMYRYWQGLEQNQSRGGASTTPANPVSNISNGALGYFSAHTAENKSLRIR